MAKYKFYDIAINSTAKKKPADEDKYTYLGLEHLDSGCLQVNRFGSEVAPIGEKLIMKKGDVLFGKRRAYQKKVAIAPFDGIFSAHGMVLRPNEKVIDKDYFPFFISSDYFLNASIKISVGSLSPTINWPDLKELEFDLPNIEDQELLAKILWAAEDLKQKYIQSLQEAMEYKSSFLKTELSQCEDQVDLSYYGELVKSKYNGPFDYVQALELDCMDQGTGKLLKINNSITGGSGYTCFQEGDILFGKLRPYLKKYYLADFEGICCNEIWAIRPNGKAISEFLFAIVSSDDFVTFNNNQSFGTKMPRSSWNIAKVYKCPKISIEKQKQLSVTINQFQRAIDILLDSISNVSNIQKQIINNVKEG